MSGKGEQRAGVVLVLLAIGLRVAVYLAAALAAFAVLTLPVEARDLVVLAGAGLWVIVALGDFAAAWIFFVLVLPFVHL